MLTNTRFIEAREADARVENCVARKAVDVIERTAVVDAEQEIARRADAIDHVCPIAARFYAVVVRVAYEEALFFTQRLIETQGLRMEVVGARTAADVIVAALRIAQLIGQRIKFQIVQRNRAEPRLWNQVAREGCAPHA